MGSIGLVFLVTFSLASFVFAEAKLLPTQGTLISVSVNDPLINEIISVRATKDHHFNLEAPQSCGPDSTINPAAKSVECQFHTSGEKTIKVSVCDDQKKYCKPDTVKVNVRTQTAKTNRMKAAVTQPTQEMQDKMKKLLLAGFHPYNPEQARAEMGNNKAILTLVSTEWCPPCNNIKEFLMQTAEFKEATKDMLLVYVDGDSTLIDVWKPILKSYFYPTFLILNKNLEVVDMKPGSMYAYQFKEWAEDSLQHLDDPLTELHKRVQARVDKKLGRQFLDLFVSTKNKRRDEKRLIQVMQDRNQLEELTAVLSGLSAERFKSQLALLQFRNYLMGKPDASQTPEDLAAKKKKLAKEILTQPLDSSDGVNFMYFYIAKDYCSSKDKNVEGCKKIFADIMSYYREDFESNKGKLLSHELIMEQSGFANSEAQVSETMGDPELAAEQYQQCHDLELSLTAYTPLKEKSRAVAFGRLYCLKDKKSNTDIELLESLVTQYPFDSTFYYKLADAYSKKKEFAKALAINEKAVKYAYGNYWAGTINQRVGILKDLKKDKEALSLIDASLNEVSLNENDEKQMWLSRLRQSRDELQKKVVR